jgi:hypothetical protein
MRNGTKACASRFTRVQRHWLTCLLFFGCQVYANDFGLAGLHYDSFQVRPLPTGVSTRKGSAQRTTAPFSCDLTLKFLF